MPIGTATASKNPKLNAPSGIRESHVSFTVAADAGDAAAGVVMTIPTGRLA
jgi:hypothetical protein